MKKYFNVTYFVADGIYSSNIAIAENEEDVRNYYIEKEKTDKVYVSECPEYDLEENRRKGMPFVEVPHKEIERDFLL